jgi:hypothetical protein
MKIPSVTPSIKYSGQWAEKTSLGDLCMDADEMAFDVRIIPNAFERKAE